MNTPEQPVATTLSPTQNKILRALRSFCHECQGGFSPSVLACRDTGCPLYPWRLTDNVPMEHDRPIRDIRRYCIVCAGDRKETRSCAAKGTCALWPYRFGVLPQTHARVMARLTQPQELWLPGFGKRG